MDRNQVFISYSHNDIEWLKKLRTMLKPLEHKGTISVWADTDIKPGRDWRQEIEQALARAKVAVLLVSPDFLASNFIAEHELPRLLDAAEQNELTVIWIPVLASLYKETDIERYQAAHDPKKPLADLNPAEQSHALVEIARVIKAAFPSSPPITPSGAVQISTARLPITGEHLVGREPELDWLDQAWDDSGVHIVVIVAWGGVGKSALVNGWLGALARDNYRGGKRVFGWTFYSQGSGESRAASADPFIDAALRWFGDPDSSAGSPWEKGERLARYVRQHKTLLILDGLEPLQYPPGPMEGRLKDPSMQALLRELAAANPGLCVITTREAVTDLNPYSHSIVSVRKLGHLSEEAGTTLLRELGVQGPDAELWQACREVRSHALTLNLLGNYLRKAWGGDIRARSEVGLLEADEKQGGHAGRVMQAYERWLGEGAELAILRVLGLFDRAAEGKALAALRAKPVIPGLTDSFFQQRKATGIRGLLGLKELIPLSKTEWNWAVTTLRDAGLLAAASPHEPDTLDAHPLIREYFGKNLREQSLKAWRKGQNRLYEYFKTVAPKFPETLDAMLLLCTAVYHGCQAGQQQEVLDKVYLKRIRWGRNEFFITKNLGAFGADLAALTCFFECSWDQPAAALTKSDKFLLLNDVGFDLRALGRLSEAVQPMELSLEAAINRRDWLNAAISAGNLSELYTILGNLIDALRYAEQSVEFADRSGYSYQQISKRTYLAYTLHQIGYLSKAEDAFREAEAMQKWLEPYYPWLYSMRGFRYCDLILDQSTAVVAGRLIPSQSVLEAGYTDHGDTDISCRNWALAQFREVQQRAELALKIVLNGSQNLIDIALSRLSLGLALLLETLVSESSDFDNVALYLKQAVDDLRRAGEQEFIACGLLARATLYRAQSNWSAAEADLTEALDIATRGQMKLHEADTHLEFARLHLARGDREQAHCSLQTAKQMVEQMGYHRRDWRVRELEKKL